MKPEQLITHREYKLTTTTRVFCLTPEGFHSRRQRGAEKSAEVDEIHHQEVQRLQEEAGVVAGSCSVTEQHPGCMEGPDADVRPQPRWRWSPGL